MKDEGVRWRIDKSDGGIDIYDSGFRIYDLSWVDSWGFSRAWIWK
jgi:hypothetical protein